MLYAAREISQGAIINTSKELQPELAALVEKENARTRKEGARKDSEERISKIYNS